MEAPKQKCGKKHWSTEECSDCSMETSRRKVAPSPRSAKQGPVPGVSASRKEYLKGYMREFMRKKRAKQRAAK
jgi:hypothetical protein